MYDIITFGSTTRDIVITSKKLTILKYDKAPNGQEVCFPLGSKSDIDDIQFVSGGGGTNTAATFAYQGLKVAFCGAVGQDVTGQEIIHELKRIGIDTRFVVKKSAKKTNHSVVILQTSQDRTILAYRGAAELLEKKDIPFRKLKTKWLYLAPLTGLLCDSFEEIVNFAKKNKIMVAANPSMAQLSLSNFSEIVKNIDVLFLNQEEASFLTKIPFQQEKEIFKKLDELCPNIAVMTKGGEGVTVSDGKQIYSAKPHEMRSIVDTTGAGDSFGAGFVTEFMKTGDIAKAIQLGMANSQGCLSEIGAKNGLLKKDQQFERVAVHKESM